MHCPDERKGNVMTGWACQTLWTVKGMKERRVRLNQRERLTTQSTGAYLDICTSHSSKNGGGDIVRVADMTIAARSRHSRP